MNPQELHAWLAANEPPVTDDTEQVTSEYDATRPVLVVTEEEVETPEAFSSFIERYINWRARMIERGLLHA